MSDIFVGQKIMQPKKEIMSYLASKGIKVPQIYNSIEEAIKDKDNKEIILRSEHPQDYEGISDLFPSSMLTKELLNTNKDITKSILEKAEKGYDNSPAHLRFIYCTLLELDYHKFISEFSHSPWETIYGVNRTMFADSAITNKYHVITHSPFSYSIVEKDAIIEMTDRDCNKITPKDAEGLIELYEQTRALLDNNHCYIMETETVKNHRPETFDHFALQVHRGRQFSKADFKAEMKYKKVIRLHEIIGSTNPEGEELLLTVKYPIDFAYSPKLIVEDASMETSKHQVHEVFSEIMFRKRHLQIMPYSYRDGLRHDLTSHCSINSLFKPQCSALICGSEIYKYIDKKEFKSQELVQKRIHYVSDGRRAYLSFIE